MVLTMDVVDQGAKPPRKLPPKSAKKSSSISLVVRARSNARPYYQLNCWCSLRSTTAATPTERLYHVLTVVSGRRNPKYPSHAPMWVNRPVNMAASSPPNHSICMCMCVLEATIDPVETLTQALRDLCSWIVLELQLNELVALTSVVFAVGATLAWTKFLHPKK